MAAKKNTAEPERPTTNEERLRALDAARVQIEQQYGKGALMQLGTGVDLKGIETIPSGSILLDEALGIGGYPKGRIIEVYGPESSGKTTLALHAVAEAQRRGGIAAFIDAEHALDPTYAAALGVNTEELWVAQPDNGEQALEIAESLVRSGAVDIIVVDSVAALTPQAEIQGEMGDSHVGLQARLMSQALRKLTGIISKSHSCLVFINQIRMKIGVMFGNPETTTGGNALKFYASVRLEVRRIETINQGADQAIGNRVRVKVAKNKVAPPFRKVELEIMFGKGVSALGSLLDSGVNHGIISKSGSWYSYGDERIGQGRENARKFLEDNPEIATSIEREIRAKLFPNEKPQQPRAEQDASASVSGSPSPSTVDGVQNGIQKGSGTPKSEEPKKGTSSKSDPAATATDAGSTRPSRSAKKTADEGEDLF
jgi:recombination protein RecA